MNILDSILLCIFPKTCGICGKVGNYICENCKMFLQNKNIYYDRLESYKTDSTKFFNYHYYLFSYEEPIRRKIIEYKFKNKPYLFHMFSEFFVKNEKVSRFLKTHCDIIIPVPMTKKKVAKRGYNQSALIAKEIAKNYEKLTYNSNILIKQKENKTQSTLGKKERIENVKNVYKIQNEQTIKEKNIVLLDDIYTTGATANECSRMLKNAGAKEVSIFTIAKDFEK